MKVIVKNSDLVFRIIPAREFLVNIPSKANNVLVNISLKQGVEYVIDFNTAPVDQNINIFTPTGSTLITQVEVGKSTVRFTPKADYDSVKVTNWSAYNISKISVRP